MKQRTITGLLIFLFMAPFIIFGGYPMAIFVLILCIIGMYEFLNIKKKANQQPIPIYIYFLCIIFSLLMIFDISYISQYAYDFEFATLENYGLNILWVVLSIATLFTCSIFDKKYSFMDAIYSFATMMFLTLGLKGMLYLRSFNSINNINDGTLLIVYVLITSSITDIFAYFGGMTCYKLLGTEKVHKLNERISPKKTIEGSLIGTLFGTVFGFIFAYFFLNGFGNTILSKWYVLLIMSFALSLSGQIGDLILSANKRHFEIKDYSKLLPGHGGVLDRIDSTLLNCMIASLFISLLA